MWSHITRAPFTTYLGYGRSKCKAIWPGHPLPPILDNHISKAAATLAKLPNTNIPSFVLEDKKYSQWWQAHLERISDFLLPGKGVWWQHDSESNNIEFFDSEPGQSFEEEGPTLHHFRSNSLKEKESFLTECREECIPKYIPLPAYFLYQENQTGKVNKITIGYLSHAYY